MTLSEKNASLDLESRDSRDIADLSTSRRMSIEPTQGTLLGVPYSVISLVTLTVQNSLLTILLHYSRTSPTAKPYSAAAAVLLNELLKGGISLAVALHVVTNTTELPHDLHTSPEAWYTNASEWKRRIAHVKTEVLSSDCWKLAIPACCYVLQNNLQYVAASNLDVATFQVTYQMKILTTALFSVLMLRRRLTAPKWASLCFLAMGVAIVQLQSSSASNSEHASQMNPITGFLAVSCACLTSGFAGVYFELVLKGSKTSLWCRNIQLSTFSLVPALGAALFPDGLLSGTPATPADPETWLFSGFGFWAWSTVLCQVFGGLVTALVIKYSNNIAKGFATSLSILISFVAGVFLFGTQVTTSFVVGCSIVLASTYLYNLPSKEPVATIPPTPLLGSRRSSIQPLHLFETTPESPRRKSRASFASGNGMMATDAVPAYVYTDSPSHKVNLEGYSKD